MQSSFLRSLLCGLLLALPLFARAQMGFNSPATITPRQDVEMYSRNSFLVQQKYTITPDPISTVQIMSCVTNPARLTATAGLLINPGGNGNYPSNTTCTQQIGTATFSTSIGYEVTIPIFSMSPGDSLIIEDTNRGRIGFSGSTILPVLFIAGSRFTVIFKSDNITIPGQVGFQLRWRMIYPDFGTATPTNDYFGNTFQFNATNGSLIAGKHGVGTAQQAGNGAVILGNDNSAGDYSVAMGIDNQAAGSSAIAMGSFNRTTDYGAVAIGSINRADGNYSVAIGHQNEASGNYSTALGVAVSTNNFTGAFIVGDASTPIIFPNPAVKTLSTAANQFTARFAGGYRLFSNSTTTIGVQIAAGGNAWSAISDSTKKERFLPLNHADLLTKLRTLRLGTWNYKGQRTERHYGPMAQDFFARFGHDALGRIGCDTLLNSHDFTAITLSGVQALALENEALKARIAQLERERNQTTARLDALERQVFVRPAPRTSGVIRRKRTR